MINTTSESLKNKFFFSSLVLWAMERPTIYWIISKVLILVRLKHLIKHICFICKLIHVHVIFVCGELSFVIILCNFHMLCILHNSHVIAFYILFLNKGTNVIFI